MPVTNQTRENGRGRLRSVRVLVALAALAIIAVAAAEAGRAPWRTASAAGPFTDPHGGSSATADTCAACHRAHTGKSPNELSVAGPQSSLCLACHNGTGANSNVAAEYSDPAVPANNASTSSYYSHPATTPSNHTSAQTSEFAGVLNRHAECSDCHNPHRANAGGGPVATSAGWTVSGALTGATGVTTSMPATWKNPITHEAELCLKCHSSYTTLLAQTKESYKMTDTGAEFRTTNSSFHPVEGPGTNNTQQMQNSLQGGKLWRFNVGDTIRCTNCHGNGTLVGSTPALNSPAPSARLAPHASKNRGLLIANYEDRVLKTRGAAYNSNDFALCFLCHSEGPFNGSGSGNDTNFSLHRKHVSGISGEGNTGAGTDIDTAGAGQGNALCAECHFRTHSTQSAYRTANQTYQRLVNFAPNVLASGTTGPSWSVSSNSGSCTLTCHGKNHSSLPYGLPAQAPAVVAPALGTILALPGTGLAPALAPVGPGAPATTASAPTPAPTPTPTPVRPRGTATPGASLISPSATATPIATAAAPTPAPTPAPTALLPSPTPTPTPTPARRRHDD